MPKREISGVRCVGMPSTSDVPCLRNVRAQPSFDTGTNVVPALLGRNPDELENSEDCGSAGGHGNQHVRLRGASIDASKRSARLLQRLLPWAGQAVRSPEVLYCLHQERGSDPAEADRDPLKTAAGRRSGPDFFFSPEFHMFRWLAAGPGIMLEWSSADAAGLIARTP